MGILGILNAFFLMVRANYNTIRGMFTRALSKRD